MQTRRRKLTVLPQKIRHVSFDLILPLTDPTQTLSCLHCMYNVVGVKFLNAEVSGGALDGF